MIGLISVSYQPAQLLACRRRSCFYREKDPNISPSPTKRHRAFSIGVVTARE